MLVNLLRYIPVTALFLAVLATSGCSGPPEAPAVALSSPAGPASAEPHLAVAPDGTVVLSWLQRTDETASLNFSVLDGAQWLPARSIASGNNWFVNWADFPSVEPVSADLWAAHWLVRRAGGKYAYDVAVSLSWDGGMQWGPPIIPHTDGTATEHGFVTLFPHNGGVGALWLDGRNMSPDGHEGHDQHSEDGGGMTLRTVTVEPDGSLHAPQMIDDLVCDCCQTDVAIGENGPVIVYRNRTTDEIRDIYVMVERNGQWQTGVPVANDGWKIAGCPVNGPAVAAEANRLAVAWFTAANDHSRVRFARSANNGDSFTEAVDIDGEKPVGRVDVALLDKGAAAVSWLRPAASGKGGEVCVRRVLASGELGPVHVIASTSTARQSGFPQMLRRGQELVFAWTDTADEVSGIKTALMPISNL